VTPAAAPARDAAQAARPRGDASRRWRELATGSLLFVLVGLAWTVIAHSGLFPAKLFPTLGTVAQALLRLVADGTLAAAIGATLLRLLCGFMLAGVVGVAIGLLMGRYAWIEDTLLPIVSFMYPIPGIAYAPLFVLWFGLGDVPAILLVGVASCFTVIINTWRGVKSVKPIWIRSADVMGARGLRLFASVILPASLPYVLAGLRLGLASAWRILVAVEMLMSVTRGLGWMIFGSQQFLNTDVMLATIAVIGVIGMLLEHQMFARIERATVVRWGMMAR
jgi:NitT/TauT family transport system permease protein